MDKHLFSESPDEISVHCTVDKLVEGLEKRGIFAFEYFCLPLPQTCVQTQETLFQCFCHADLASCFPQGTSEGPLDVQQLLQAEEPVFLMESLRV